MKPGDSLAARTRDAPGDDETPDVAPTERIAEMYRFALGVLAYAVPTFALGYAWHLILFDSYYASLAIYRSDIIVPFGFLSILVQGAIFAWIYGQAVARQVGSKVSRALLYGGLGATLSWSFTTLAVAAKNIMASVPDYVLIETAFTVVQWAVVAPLTVLVCQPPREGGGQPSANEAA